MTFEIVYQRGIFGKMKWNMKFRFCRGILDISGQELLSNSSQQVDLIFVMRHTHVSLAVN